MGARTTHRDVFIAICRVCHAAGFPIRCDSPADEHDARRFGLRIAADDEPAFGLLFGGTGVGFSPRRGSITRELFRDARTRRERVLALNAYEDGIRLVKAAEALAPEASSPPCAAELYGMDGIDRDRH